MAEPPGGSLPGSPKIKKEPQETPSVAPIFNTAEKPEIVEISDDEVETPARALGSPFIEQSQEEPKTTEAINLGASLLSSKPKPAKPDLQETLSLRAQLQQVRRDTAQQFQQKPVQRTPDPVGRSEIFVTNSHPGTPDPAEIFRALRQDFESKKSRGVLSDLEEIEFMRAETEEKIRLFRERAEANQEALDGEGSTTRPPRSFAVPELDGDESSDEQPEPKKRGRKRKADTDAKPQPNKRRQPNNDSTEDILVVARRKLEAKAKAKVTKGKRATKNDQNSKGGAGTNKKSQKYKGPSMLNRDDLFGGTDFVSDAARNEHLANPPTFDPSTKRSTAFKQLLASVPDGNRKIAKIDKKYFEDQLKYFTGKGHSVKPAADGNWEVKGMKVSLKPYQILGVSFLRSRENATEEPRGGILADQMGLGKTIQMLANIVNARPLLKKDCRTTLIVASAALVSQWRQEIADKVFTRRENKTHGVGRVMEYHANSQALGNEQIEMLLECDIVLTTYTQVSKSYPKAEPPAKFVTAEQKLEWWKTYYEKNKGILHRIRWARVILDEAQAIKNYKSLTSRSCCALESIHHWSISGTPVTNHLREFYAHLKFLRVPWTGSFKIFKQNHLSGDDPDGIEKLIARLSQFMCRRTHRDQLFDARLLVLPTPSQEKEWIDFNPVERAVYDIVKARFIKRINGMSSDGELDKKYSFIWTMLLKLRQLCSHILLIQTTLADLLHLEDFERLRTISNDDLSDDCEELLVHLTRTLKDRKGAKKVDATDGNIALTETENAPIDLINYEPTDSDLGGQHGLSYNFGRYLDSLKDSGSFEEICQRALCNGCRQPSEDPHVLSCFHIYCKLCLHDLQVSSARKGLDRHRCNECGEHYTDAKPCEKELKPYTEGQDDITGGSRDTGNGEQEPEKKPEAENWTTMKGPILPSAKTIALKARILTWIKEDPDVKIIVYSAFIPMLHLLGRICRTENWKTEKYTGSMSHDSRRKALASFADKDQGVRILLASLTCGGIGLNLTCASRVISLDPWWNASTETQAFYRVYRIGQEKETQMARILIRNSIDTAIMALQESKQLSIDSVMNSSGRSEKIGLSELMQLFGRVETDEKGRPYIFAHGEGGEVDDGEPRLPGYAPDHESNEEGDGMVDDD